MKILLAPSETKSTGGSNKFTFSSLLFPELTSLRRHIVNKYSNLIRENDDIHLSEFFGLKNINEIAKYKQDIMNLPAKKAILRYTGVAFDYLDYNALSQKAQQYIDQNLIIFSNLFGALRAGDMIPDYRLQQGKSIYDIKPDLYYKKDLQQYLDRYLDGEEILDIRAGYYNKYYKPGLPYTTLKFIKNGKVVSHWAKAYRGIILREISKAGIATLDGFMALPIKGLQIKEIQTKKNKTEIIYSIND